MKWEEFVQKQEEKKELMVSMRKLAIALADRFNL